MAITGDKRTVALPQLPTYAEAGLPGYDPKNWQGILAPAGTPGAIVTRLSAEVAKVLGMAEIRGKLVRQGSEPCMSTPDQFAAMIRTEIVRYAKVIKTANIKMN